MCELYECQLLNQCKVEFVSVDIAYGEKDTQKPNMNILLNKD